jgi:hypothetical protein
LKEINLNVFNIFDINPLVLPKDQKFIESIKLELFF